MTRYSAWVAVALALALVALFGWLTQRSTPRPTTAPPAGSLKPSRHAPAHLGPLRARPPTQRANGGVYGDQIGIPILMFHRLESHPHSKFALTPAAFRTVLNALRDENYCLVSLEEYLSNAFDSTCAGRKPFALTFDDSHPSQVALDPNGSIAPDSALGVMLSVFAQPKATFFANVHNGGHPFGRDSARKVELLGELGLEIGNHTVSHARLDKRSKASVAREITGVCAYFGRSRMVFAYPYGVIPFGGIPTALPGCALSAAFGANLGYFEGQRDRESDGQLAPLLAPLPGTRAFAEHQFRLPRINIDGLRDLQRDVLENPNVYILPGAPATQPKNARTSSRPSSKPKLYNSR